MKTMKSKKKSKKKKAVERKGNGTRENAVGGAEALKIRVNEWKPRKCHFVSSSPEKIQNESTIQYFQCSKNDLSLKNYYYFNFLKIN